MTTSPDSERTLAELLPCPFCGYPPSSWEHVSRGMLVTCFKDGCPAHGNTVSPHVWNTRTANPNQPSDDARDAARYRFLRQPRHIKMFGLRVDPYDPDPMRVLDATIDAALAAQPDRVKTAAATDGD